MENSSRGKSETVNLSTFLKWGICGITGHKTGQSNGITNVSFIWCKICTKYKGQILYYPSVKGASTVAAQTFINCTSSVTKFSITFFSFFLLQFVNFSFFMSSPSTKVTLNK